MKGFTEIRPGEVWDGDFVSVKVVEGVVDGFLVHWCERLRFFCVKKARNNTFSAKDCRGVTRRFGYNQIVRAYRKEW